MRIDYQLTNLHYIQMTKFKTITDEQLEDWNWDEAHIYTIVIHKKHLLKWFNNTPLDDEYDWENYPEFDFKKNSKNTFYVTVSRPDWANDVDGDELEQAVLESVHLKKEWVEDMSCDG